MNNIAVTSIYKLLCGYVFISLGFILGNGITVSYSNLMFNLLRICQTGFQSSTILHSYPWYEDFSFSKSLLTLVNLSFDHSGGCDVVSHGSFVLHFPDV